MLKKLPEPKPEPAQPSKSTEEKGKHSNHKPVKEWLSRHYEFRFNQIKRSLEFRKIKDPNFRAVQDEDIDDIYWDLQEYGINFSKERLVSFIKSHYISVRLNDITEYYGRLTPIKGDSNFLTLCSTIKLCKLDDKIKGRDEWDLFLTLFKRWLISCYTCNLARGGNQVCLVLIGKQGTYKSTWLDKLVPADIQEYATRCKLDLNPSNKDTLNLLAEKVFINVDDQLVNIQKKDHDSIKNLITLQDISVRKAYATMESKRKRIANFMASVNQADFLTDTENRRYLCFEIERCNPMNVSNELIRNVWSEVKYWVEEDKEQTYFTKEEEELQRLMNQQFVAVSAEREWLDFFFKSVSANDAKDGDYWLQSQMLQFMQEKTRMKISGKILSNELERAKFVKQKKRIGDKAPTNYWLARKIRDSVDDQSINQQTVF